MYTGISYQSKDEPAVISLSYGIFSELLFHYSESLPPLEEQLYLFMKRFRTPPSEFYAMDREERLKIFHREYNLVKKEARRVEELESKHKE